MMLSHCYPVYREIGTNASRKKIKTMVRLEKVEDFRLRSDLRSQMNILLSKIRKIKHSEKSMYENLNNAFSQKLLRI